MYIGGKCANESTNTTIKFVCDPNETFVSIRDIASYFVLLFEGEKIY